MNTFRGSGIRLHRSARWVLAFILILAISLCAFSASAFAEDFAEEPVSEAPAAETPVSEAPVAEEPAPEAPVAEEPAPEAPVAEEPAPEAPVAEESTPEAPVAEEPVSEAPVAETLALEAPGSAPLQADVANMNVELKTSDETIKAATENLSFSGGDKTPGNLQAAIDAAVQAAQEDDSEIVTVVLEKDTTYTGKVNSLNTRGDTFEKFVFTCEDGTATIDSKITINEEILVEIVNVLFGNDCLIQVENDGQLTVGSEKNRFNGDLKVIAGKWEEEDNDNDMRLESAGYVTVYAGDGASVTADVISSEDDKSTVTVINSAGDSVVFSARDHVGIVSGEKETTDKNCVVTISSNGELTVDFMNAWDADLVLNSPDAIINQADKRTIDWLKRFTGDHSRAFDINELHSFKIIAASEDKEVFDLTDELNLSDLLAQIGINDVFTIKQPKDEAHVKINAGIKALEDITVYSYTTQTKSLLDSFVNLGPNVKVGIATIELADGAELTAGKDITLKATTRSNAGYDENGQLDESVLPFAFNIFVEEASIKLNNATLVAGGDVTADALSTVVANASCSFGPLSVGVAFNVIVNRASVEAVGTQITAGGDINLVSKAETEAEAAAERKHTADSMDGMYFASNVVVQSSEVNTGAGTVLDAGGDVNISSTSDVDATDDAIASAGKDTENVSALPVTGILKTLGYELLDKVTDKLKDSISEAVKSDLEKAAGFFETDGYSIEIDSAAQEKGTVKVSSTGSSGSKDGVKEKILVSVNSKYDVQQVLIRYLPVGSNEYKFSKAVKNADSGNYELDLNAITDPITLGQFRVYVFYSDEMKSEVELDDMPSKDNDDDFGLADLFDSALESAADDSDADPDCGGNIILKYVYKFDGKEDAEKGTVLTDAMAAGVSMGTTSLSALTGVAEGKNVRFNPNCAVGYQVKTMTATYKDGEGEKTVTIEKNNAGHYVFAVPSGIQNNSLTITTEFEVRKGEKSADKPSENQITGSLGIGVIVNHNDAVVDLGTGSITADGKVNVSAEATSNIDNTADGSAVTEKSIEKGKTVKQMATGLDLDVNEVKVKENGEDTKTKLYVYGKSSGDVTATLSGTVYTVALAPDADLGFKLPSAITIILLGEDNREHAVKVAGKDGVYTVDTKYIDFKTDSVSDEETENGLAVRSVKLLAVYDSNIYKVSTDVPVNGKFTVDRSTTRGRDTITVKPTANDGYALSSIALKYKKDGKALELAFVSGPNGYYLCTLPEDSELATWEKDDKGVSMTVYALFKQLGTDTKHTIKVDGSVDANLKVDKTTAYCGEKVTIKLTEAGKNYRINADKLKVSYTLSGGTESSISIDPSDLSFVIPVADAISSGAVITVSAQEGYLTYMNVPVEVKPDIANGTAKIENNKDKTGGGDVFCVNVKGSTGYILKLGTLRAEYDKGGTETIRLGAPVLVSDGLYKFIVPETVGNENNGKITISAEFTQDDSSSSSTGIAVAVNVNLHKNNALIKSGSITAVKGVSVSAVTNGKAVTEALAGYSSAKTGIAGAIAVGVANFKTYAVIGNGVRLNAGDLPVSEAHELSVSAESNISTFKTDANANTASGQIPTAGEIGVGAGIAVAVNGVNTVASVNDGVVYGYTRTIGKAASSASNTIRSDEVSAKSGASSKKTSVTPLVALNIINSGAKAYIGTFKDGTPLNAKLVELKASNAAAHKMTADATSIGGASALAGSFGINLLDDSARAILNSSINGYNAEVVVDAQSVSTLEETTVKASSMGANPGKKKADDSKGSADQKADSLIGSGQKLGAKAGMGAPTENSVKNRQQAQTSEGSIAGAAAFVLNIQNNESEARIADGKALGSSVNKLGDVSVSSRIMSSADITADGSASSTYTSSENRTGIGVAVAINIVNSDNTACIGTGLLNAGHVSVIAAPTKDAEGKPQTSSITTSAISGASASGVSVAGGVALAVVNSTTTARIRKASSDFYNAASTAVRAEDLRVADTTASAGKSEKGTPNKNLSKIDTQKPADADMSESIGVGASFAMIYGDNTVLAEFIAPATVNDVGNTGELLCEAVSDHSEESTAVAGTDPYKTLCDPLNFKFTGQSSAIAVDAAVAVNAIHSTITAQLPADSGYTPVIHAGSVRLNAVEKGHSKTDSSGFAMGQDTAVGGSVAVNLNVSSARASNGCTLKVSGDDAGSDDGEYHPRSVAITASSDVTEENNAYAMAAGGDIIRYVEKYKSQLSQIDIYKQHADKIEEKADALSEIVKGLLDGSYFDQIEDAYDKAVADYKTLEAQIREDIAKDGKTDKSLLESAALVANSGNRLAQTLMSFVAAAKRVQAVGSQVHSLSTTLLKLLNVGAPSTGKMDETTNKAAGETNKSLNGSDASVDNNGAANKDSESMQIAAAVGVSVSNHEVIAENKGEIETVGSVEIRADNTVDAIAHAHGYAASTNGGMGSIALAIAVKVDENTTKAISEKSITVGSGKAVVIAANLNENTRDKSQSGTDIDFTQSIGTEAIAGAVSGGAKLAVSGAVVVFVSSSETLAELCDNAVIRAVSDKRAGDVSILATETARQTLRTMALSGSKANLTMGISAGVMVTENVTRAKAGKNTSIKARNIAVMAERKSVSLDNDTGLDVKTTEGEVDFGNKDDQSDGEDGEAGPSGVEVKGPDGAPILEIDTGRIAGAQANGVDPVSVRLGAEKAKDYLEKALNQFASVDYYIAVDSGAVAVGSAKASTGGIGSIAGSVAVVTISNTLEALVGEGAVLDSLEDVYVVASSAEQTRLISGAISASPSGSKATVGAVIAFLYEKNSILSSVGDGAVITAGKDFFVVGKNTGRSEVYTVTASGSGGSTATVAATIDVILSEASVSVRLGNPGAGRMHTAQAASVLAENSKALRNITVSLAASLGQGSVQAGGAVAVILEDSSAIVRAQNTKLSVSGKPIQYAEDESKTPYALDSIVIKADNTHDMFVIVASASVASGSKANVAGVVSVILDQSNAEVYTGGSTFNSNIASPNTQYAGNVIIAAANESDLLNANVQVTAGGSGAAAVGAAVTVNILKRQVINEVSTLAAPTVIALNNGDVSLTADAKDRVIVVAAGANGSAANTSVQGTILVLVETNTAIVTAKNITLKASNLGVSIRCGDTTIRAKFGGELYGVAGGVNFTTGSTAAGATIVVAVTDNITTVDMTDSVLSSAEKADILASAETKTLLISIGAAVSGSTAAEGAVETVVASDTVSVHLGKTSIESGIVNIKALGKSSETYISGALAGSGSISVGPSVLVFTKQRNILIDSAPGGSIGGANGCNVVALANTVDDIFTLVLAMSAAGTTAVSAGICTEVINNTVLCDMDADINAGGYVIDVAARSDRHIANYIFGGGFSGTISVVPVATVIYLTDTVTSDVSGNLKGYTVNVLADTAFKLREYSIGAAVAGTAGISGTFAIVVNAADTRAIFTGAHSGRVGSDVTQRPSLNVLANDTYNFRSLMANLAGGATAAVGVTAAVTVVSNNVLASVGDSAVKKNISADNVTVSANSLRTVKNLIGTLAIGGTAGASVNVCVVVAGSKLPQDAYDMMTTPNGNGTTFDSAALLASVRSSNSYAANNGCLDTVTLASDIQGNGQRDSETKVGNVDGQPFVEDLANEDTTSDYTGSEAGAKEAATLRGEECSIDPSTDESVNKNAEAGKNAGYRYDDNAAVAAVQAIVKNVSITCKELAITANDTQVAEIDSVTGAVSGTVAASVGVSVLVLHSNVFAELDSTADVICRNLTINAYSGSGEDGSVKVSGGVVSAAGTVAVGVAVAVVHLDNLVRASLDGHVTAAPEDGSGINATVNVIANSHYNNVLAETLAFGAGGVGVAASVAVVSLNGEVSSVISGSVSSHRDSAGAVDSGFYKVNVFVFFNNSVTARAACLGAGAVGAALGVAIASETLTVNAGIENGARVELDTTSKNLRPTLCVLVAGSYDEDKNQTTQALVQSHAEIASVAVGGLAVGVSVAVSYIHPELRSYINGTVSSIGKLDVTVGNDIYTKSNTGLYSAAAATGAAFGANVLVSYNTTDSASSVSGTVTADTLTVMSLLSADAVSNMKGISAAPVNIGVSTAISILNAKNEAAVDEGAEIAVRTLNILAGATAPGNYQAGANFFSDAQLYSGSVSGFAVQLNVAVAVNKAVNKASINTNGKLHVDSLNVYAYGNPTASAATNKFSVALVGVGGSAAASTLSFVQLVEINCTNLSGLNQTLTDINGGSYMYPGEAKDPAGEEFKRDYDQASASVDIFEIAGLSIGANVSYAKNTTVSRITAMLGSKVGKVTLENNGSANALASVAEVGGNVLGIGANVMLSYVQAQFITVLSTNDVDGDVQAVTDFVSNAHATVTAASGSLIGLQANVVVAKSTTVGTTSFNANGHDVHANSVSVSTIGDSATQADVLKPAKVTVAAVEVGANIIESILKTTQSARLENMNLVGAPTVLVSSVLNAGSDSRKHSASALFEGAPDATSISLGKLNVNVILAKNYAQNLASVYNVSSSGTIDRITVTARNSSNAFANVGTAKNSNGLDVALVSVGVVVTVAENTGSNRAVVEKLAADVNTLDVTATMTDASAESYGGVSSEGVVSVAEIAVNVSEASNNAVNAALIKDSKGKINTLILTADAENVHAEAYIGSAELSVSAVNIATNIVTATNNYNGSTRIEGSELQGSSLSVQSLENRHFFETAKYKDVTSASVGSTGGTKVSLISGAVNSAAAVNVSQVTAVITGSVLTDYAVSILANGRSDVSTSIASPSMYGLLNVAAIQTKALANGTVLAEFDPTETLSSIASLDVKALGSADAEALTGTAGSLAALASFSSNTADSDVRMLVRAAVSGGKLNVKNNAAVNSLASAVSKAEAQTPGFVLAAMQIGINEVKANSAIQVEADVLPGEYTIGGQLDVNARIPTEGELREVVDNTRVVFDGSSTTSIVRPSAGDDSNKTTTQIALVNGNNHRSTAVSGHTVIVNIGGREVKGIVNAGILSAASVNISAIGNAQTVAKTLDVDESYGIATIGGSIAHATESDLAQININAESLIVSGALTATASNNSADLHAVGTTPGGFSAVDVSKTEMKADLHNAARIRINDNVPIRAGSVSFKAANSGNAETSLTENASKHGLLRVTDASAPVTASYTTELIFGSGSTVQSAGSIKLATETNSESYSNVSQATGAAAFDAAMLRGQSNVTSTNRIQLASGVVVSADNNDVIVDMINKGYLRARSDYHADFTLIGVSQVRAENSFTAKNIFDMESGSALIAQKGSVKIEQNNSDIKMECSSASEERSGIGAGDAGGTNTVVSDNTLNFTDIRAAKSIELSQYGGAAGAEAYGTIYDKGLGGTCKANGINDFTINNLIHALDDADLSAAEITIMQGADNLDFNSGARGFGEGLAYKIDGRADNLIHINNELNGGTKEIGASAGENRIYVSDIDADGEILCDMQSGGALIEWGNTSSENKLQVKTRISKFYSVVPQYADPTDPTNLENPFAPNEQADPSGNTAGFKAYQNKFDTGRIRAKGSTKNYTQTVSYDPDKLQRYEKPVDPVDPVDPVNPNNRSLGHVTGSKTANSNVFAQLILERLTALKNNKDLAYGMKCGLKDGFLVIENSALFAADLDQMDVDWLYEFLTGDSIRFMARFTPITEEVLDTALSDLVDSSFDAGDVVITKDSITFTVVCRDETHRYEIVFDRESEEILAYCLDNNKRSPVTLFIIELDGVMNVIVYEEEPDTKPAFILIPDLLDEELPPIKVKVKDSFLKLVGLEVTPE